MSRQSVSHASGNARGRPINAVDIMRRALTHCMTRNGARFGSYTNLASVQLNCSLSS
jgi:hypothetical protein